MPEAAGLKLNYLMKVHASAIITTLIMEITKGTIADHLRCQNAAQQGYALL